jgi:Rrf2 family cysteine metabolism transcriptional repressor
MKLSTKTRYGMRAMIDLALVHGSEDPITIKELAKRNRIPESFLEQLLGTLRKKGLVRSIRGPQGGYVLGKEPGDIVVADIINSLEGPIKLAECIDDMPLCGEFRNCPSRILWTRIKESIEGVTRTTTLKDLISEYEGHDERKGICND